MKKLPFIALVVLLFSLSAFVSMIAFAQTGKMVEYKGQMPDIHFKYPADWKLEDSVTEVRLSDPAAPDNSISISTLPLTGSVDDAVDDIYYDFEIYDTTINGQKAYIEDMGYSDAIFFFGAKTEFDIYTSYESDAHKPLIAEIVNSIKVE